MGLENRQCGDAVNPRTATWGDGAFENRQCVAAATPWAFVVYCNSTFVVFDMTHTSTSRLCFLKV